VTRAAPQIGAARTASAAKGKNCNLLRERILVWLDMTLGLRRGELAGLRWEDIRFQDLTVMARRSVVDQVVGNVKTEASKRPIPIDPFIAEDLLAWYRSTKYSVVDHRKT
jgi:integrase